MRGGVDHPGEGGATVPSRFSFAVFAAALLFLPAATAAAEDSQTPTRKQQLVAELLDVTKASQFGEYMVETALARIQEDLRRLRPDAPPRAEEIVEQEFRRAYEARESELIAPVMRLYAEGLTAAELEQILRYYRSPLGQKTIATAPAMLAAGMWIGHTLSSRAAGQGYERALARIDGQSPGAQVSCDGPAREIVSVKQQAVDRIMAEMRLGTLLRQLEGPMQARVEQMVKARQPAIPEAHLAIVREEVGKAFQACVPQIAQHIKVIYAAPFTPAELWRTVEFASSETGAKMFELQQQAARTATQAGQQLGREVGEVAMVRAEARMKEEGVALATDGEDQTREDAALR